jgi:glycosyltransferase involved in cell wall biosynthesis
VPRFLLDALDRRFTVVGRLDYGLRGSSRLLHGAAMFRPHRGDWVARFHLTPHAYHALTKTLAERLRAVPQPFDLAFQVHGWVGGQPRPYYLYVDQTRSQIDAGWPKWLPMGQPARIEGLRLEQSMYAAAHHIFTMGEPARSSLIADYGIAKERITVTGGGINFSSLPAPRPEPATEPRILFIGREFERKGGEILLKAFHSVRKRFPTATLHVVGPRKRLAKRGVIAHGLISDRKQISELYRLARLVCAPSLYEPWGFVLTEAMAHGVPCIGTTVQSIPEILDHGRAGMLVPPSDVDAVAEAIVTLLEDDLLASRLAAHGRRRVEQHYIWDRVVDAMAPALTSGRRAELTPQQMGPP